MGRLNSTTGSPSMEVLAIKTAQKNGNTYEIGFKASSPLDCKSINSIICLPMQVCTAEVSQEQPTKMTVNKVDCNASDGTPQPNDQEHWSNATA